MGLNDREYMKSVPVYEELIGRRPPPPPPSAEVAGSSHSRFPTQPLRVGTRGATRPWAWFALGAVSVLGLIALVAAHRQPRATSFTPVVPITAPSIPSRTLPITGPSRALVGSVLTLDGTVAPQFSGPVTVTASWDGGPRSVIAGAEAVDGSYEVKVPLDRVGVVSLDVALPDGQHASSVITVAASGVPSTTSHTA